MRIHYLQHVPFEGPGSIPSWCESRRVEVSTTRLFEKALFPALSEIDGLIVLGGPMSARDDRALPWLASEKRFIAGAIAASKNVLGICLGAQLVASVLGSKVFANPEPEIGWFPIEPVPEGPESAFSTLFRRTPDVFHWHGETFELPPGATHLARSAACEHQAFSIGDRVLGIQFHLETTPAGAKGLIENCRGDLKPGKWIQTEDQMLEDEARFHRMNRVMDALLDRWCDAHAFL